MKLFLSMDKSDWKNVFLLIGIPLYVKSFNINFVTQEHTEGQWLQTDGWSHVQLLSVVERSSNKFRGNMTSELGGPQI